MKHLSVKLGTSAGYPKSPEKGVPLQPVTKAVMWAITVIGISAGNMTAKKYDRRELRPDLDSNFTGELGRYRGRQVEILLTILGNEHDRYAIKFRRAAIRVAFALHPNWFSWFVA